VARLLPLLTLAALVCLVGAFWSSTVLLVLIGIVASNLVIRVWLGDRISRVIPAMQMVPAMLTAARTLGGLQVPELAEHAEVLRRAEPRLRGVGQAARWLAAESASGNELVAYLLAYVNLLLLLDISAFAWSVGAMRTERETLRGLYESLGELDVAQSVAALRAGVPRWTRPLFRAHAERTLAFSSLVHPLLDEPVPSTLELSGGSMLLTGSNMSGKSTFIRTIGVNALLARTIHTVFAESWRAPCWAVRTSIGRGDSLLEGKSYYRAEVDAVGELLGREAREPRLVLIDELFRGTNSIERIAAAKAVLAELDRGDDLVVVATHDVELLELLPDYVRYHFREEVRDGQLTFDYALHLGACSTRNALAILELAGYPEEVVEDARRTAEGRIGNGER
jgi:DNA mismatch repair ATPase MutS